MIARKRKALLIELGISQVSIARELKVARSVVSRVVSGKATSRRVQEAVCSRLELPFGDVWGNHTSIPAKGD